MTQKASKQESKLTKCPCWGEKGHPEPRLRGRPLTCIVSRLTLPKFHFATSITMLYFFTATEKQKHLGTRFNRSGMDINRASLTLPKKIKKPSPDTISLIDSASSMESLSTAGLLGSKQLSSSLLNINEGGGTWCFWVTYIIYKYFVSFLHEL